MKKKHYKKNTIAVLQNPFRLYIFVILKIAIKF